MKRLVLFLSASAVMLSLSAIPMFAQRGGGGGRGGMGGGNMGGGNMGGNRDSMGSRSQRSQQSQDSFKASAELQKNTALAKRLEALLPNTDAQSASRGFSSVGDLMAAAHASKDLNVPFNNLKKVVTGSKKKSLDKAILQLQSSITPDAAKAAAKKAKEAGAQDIKEAKAEMKTAKSSAKS